MRLVMVTALFAANMTTSLPAQRGADSTTVHVKAELLRRYEENNSAYQRGDLAAVMRLRAPDFYTMSPDGRRQDRPAMEQYIQGIMNGIRKWNSLTVTIDSLHVVGDTAIATVNLHMDRMALRPDNQVHHVETWATQRETWIRQGGTWLLWRVDQVRNQRRLVDGKPG